MTYRDEERLCDARARYFADNDFGDDGGYAAKWVKIKAGPLPFWFPNSDERRRTIRYHDLHHILANYETDWTGEAEMGAWEVGSSCGDHWVGWYLNLVVFWVGLFIAPRRTFRAFVRGRRTRNLYREPWEKIRLEDPVGAWRQRLGLDSGHYDREPGDGLAFAGFSSIAFFCWALSSTVYLLPIALAVWGIRTFV